MQASRRAEKKCTQQAKPEGSIIEAWRTTIWNPGRGESFSRNDMGGSALVRTEQLSDEIMAYLDEHEQMMKREHPSHLVARKHRELFPQ
ncbi:hypothetical protein Prudu_1093S000100, partial [Prunus dulcis]